MVQPFDYSIRSTAQGPLQALSQGMQLGQQFAKIAEQREAQRLAQEKAQVQAEQQLRMDAALKNLNAKRSAGTATYDDFQNVVLANPGMKSLAENMTGLFNQFSTERQNNEKSYFGKVIASLQVDPSVAVQLLNQRADATAESTPNESMVMRTYARLANENPGRVADTLIAMNSGPFGKDWTESVLKVRQAMVMGPAELREASAKADKAIADAKVAQAQAGTAEAREAAGRDLAVAQARKAQIEAQVAAAEQKLTGGIQATEDIREQAYFNSLTPEQQQQWITRKGAGATKIEVGGQAAPPTPFEQALDKKAADIYTDWTLGGGSANATARIAALQDVVTKLERSATGRGPTLTGVQVQVIPEALRPRLFRASQEARQNAERVIQDGLRAILGAQFTQVEGENFLKRSFDPALGPDVNARRLRLILQQMKTSAKQSADVADYLEKNRTIRGFKGKIPSLADFEAAIQGAQPSAAAPPTTGAAVATPVPAGNVATPVTTSPAARPPIQVPPLPPTRDYGAGTRVAPAAPGGKDIGGGFRVLD